MSKKKLEVRTNREIEQCLIYKGIVHRNLKVKEVSIVTHNKVTKVRIKEISRRRVPFEIHKEYWSFKESGGNVFWPCGLPFKFPICIHLEFDLENRWYSNFRKLNTDGEPAFKSEKFDRIRLLDLWHQIRDLKGLDQDNKQ